MCLPFLLQGLTMLVDEFHFHRARGLPLWERIGHPLDTISTLVCYLLVWLLPAGEGAFKLFLGLCIFSCLLITKDEFVHSEHCPAGENWLHSILFILHPVNFGILGYLWMSNNSLLPNLLVIQLPLMITLLFYQAIYWGILWKKK